MNAEKRSFGEYIKRKRQGLGKTQKDLAGELFVAESTVSKWERGLSYPDVALIPAVCGALGISEHEFFIACDDEKARSAQRQAALGRGVVRGLRLCCAAMYLIAVAVCFVVNLAMYGGLDWFWIVLTAVALAWCCTNLPFRLSRRQAPLWMGAVTGCLLLLLLACWQYVGGHWLGGAVAIVAVSLALPWGCYALWRGYDGARLPELLLAFFSLWTLALMAVIWALAGGDWLFTIAYPLTGASLVCVWLVFAIWRWLPLGHWWKGTLTAYLVTFSQLALNALSARLVPGTLIPHLPPMPERLDLAVLLDPMLREEYAWVNLLVFAVMLAACVVLTGIGVIQAVRQKKSA